MNKQAIALLSLGHFLIDLCQGVVPALVPFLVIERQFSYAMAASLVFAISATSSIVQPLFGQLADRVGVWWLLPGSILLAGVSLAVGSQAAELRGRPLRRWTIRPGCRGLPSRGGPQSPSRQRRPPHDRDELFLGRGWSGIRPCAGDHDCRGRHMGDERLARPPWPNGSGRRADRVFVGPRG